MFANLNIKYLAIFKRFPNPGLCYFSLFTPFFWKVRIRILPIRKTAMTNTLFDLSSVTPAFSYHLLPRHQYIRYLYLHLSSWDCSQLALIQTQSLSRLSYSIDCTSKVRYNKASHAPIWCIDSWWILRAVVLPCIPLEMNYPLIKLSRNALYLLEVWIWQILTAWQPLVYHSAGACFTSVFCHQFIHYSWNVNIDF